MPNDKNGAVGGLSDDEMQRIRRLKGRIQADVPDTTVSNRDAVMWAVDNELDRRQDDE